MMLIRFYTLAAAFLASTAPQLAHAHLDVSHNMSFWQGVLHFFSDPLHLLVAAMLLFITYVGVYFAGRRAMKARNK